MARARSIGNVYAELSVKDKMTAGLKKAGKSVDTLGSKMAKLGKGLVLASPAAAMAGIAVSMKSAIDAGGELQDMMNRTGADGEQLFIIGQAFKNAGLEAGGVADAVNRMQKQLAAGSDGFSAIGLEVRDLKNMDPAKAFRAVGEALGRIGDPAERTGAAMEIFGRSGAKMLAVFNDPEAFSQAEEQVGGLGKSLSTHAASLDQFGDKLGALKLKALDLGTGVAVGLLPELDKLVTILGEVDLSGAGQGVAEAGLGMGGFLGELSKVLGIDAAGQFLGNKLVSSDIGDLERAQAGAMAASWADSDSRAWKGKGTGGAPDPFATPPGAEAARQAEWRASAPFTGGDKDKAILDELRKQTAVMQARGGPNW